MEVQGIEQVGAGWSSVVVGELLEVVPHPNADRLSLTKVKVSDTDAPLSIVCGATNIAVGQRVPVALPGSVLPGGRNIGVSTIQGVESQGMLCSGAELGLSPDADGIMILTDMDTKLGQPLVEIVGDTVLDIDVKPNRGDALSLIGLAREVAAISGTKVRWPPIEVPESGDSTNDHVWVEVGDKHLCPRFVARYVDELKIGPSPLKAQLRLMAAGQRPISNAVDASNYVMLEMGKPIHVFDASSVSGGTIIVRTAHDGEKLETLDHVERTLTPDTLLIADAGGALGIAGVMGGAHSEVGAADDGGDRGIGHLRPGLHPPNSLPLRLAQRGEPPLREGPGIPIGPPWRRPNGSAAGRVGRWATRGWRGRHEPGRRGATPRQLTDQRGSAACLARRSMRVDAIEALQRVEIDTEPGEGEALVAVVPPHRRDIQIEEDVIEEIIRVRGYETLAATTARNASCLTTAPIRAASRTPSASFSPGVVYRRS